MMPVPVITSQPTNQTVVAGQNRQLRVQATGTPAPTFQWQVSTAAGAPFNNVANGGVYGGATTDRLVITGATMALNGHRFQVVVTNADGAVTSNPATLTVTVAPAAVPVGMPATPAATTSPAGTATQPSPANQPYQAPVYDHRTQHNHYGSGDSNGLWAFAIVALIALVFFGYLVFRGSTGGGGTTIMPIAVSVPQPVDRQAESRPREVEGKPAWNDRTSDVSVLSERDCLRWAARVHLMEEDAWNGYACHR